MLYLAVVVLLVGALTVLNLVLTLGVVRRLREHTALLSAAPSSAPLMLAAGEQADEFVASTVDGEPVARDLLAGHTVVAFLSTSCTPCRERLPELIETARAAAGGRRQVLAVINGSDERTAQEYAERLAPVARVVVEPPRGPVTTAFGVRAFPSFAIVDDRGVIAVSNVDLRELPVSTGA